MRVRQIVGGTHEGTTREINEDAILRLGDVPLVAVADGMGGEGAGDVAAKLVMEAVKRRSPQIKQFNNAILKDRSTKNRLALMNFMNRLFNGASKEIRQSAQKMTKHNMGSTLTIATMISEYFYIAHVGNSRAYLYREGELSRLTEDHTVGELRQRRGRVGPDITDDDAHVLYQCLGGSFEVEVDMAEVRVAGDDILLLCTDGLIRTLTESMIAACIQADDLRGSVQNLIRTAVENGAKDNLSIILMATETQVSDSSSMNGTAKTMRDVFLFRDMSECELHVIAPYLEEEVYDKGQVVVTEGQDGDCFYIVISGHLRVSRSGIRLVDLSAGGHFGELALARPVKRSATVKTLTPTRLFSFSRERFHKLILNKPELGARISLSLLDTVGDRVRDLTNRLDEVQRLTRGDSNS